MNIMELGAVGELVGGVAVIVTLLYLALQVRQNTVAMRSQAISTRLAGQGAADTALMGNDGAEAIAKSIDRPGEMTTADVIKVENYLYSGLVVAQAAHEAHALGLSDRAEWEAALGFAPQYIGYPYGQMWWAESKSMFSDPFVAELDAELRSTEADVLVARFNRIKLRAQRLAEV